MAIYGNGTGMGFSLCGANQSVTSFEATNLSFLTVQLKPRLVSLTGLAITSGYVSVQYTSNGTALEVKYALTALNLATIKPTVANERYNQDSGKMEHFNATTETWS